MDLTYKVNSLNRSSFYSSFCSNKKLAINAALSIITLIGGLTATFSLLGYTPSWTFLPAALLTLASLAGEAALCCKKTKAVPGLPNQVKTTNLSPNTPQVSWKNISALPKEILTNIFNQGLTIGELIACSRVNKQWHQVVYSEQVLQPYFEDLGCERVLEVKTPFSVTNAHKIVDHYLLEACANVARVTDLLTGKCLREINISIPEERQLNINAYFVCNNKLVAIVKRSVWNYSIQIHELENKNSEYLDETNVQRVNFGENKVLLHYLRKLDKAQTTVKILDIERGTRVSYDEFASGFYTIAGNNLLCKSGSRFTLFDANSGQKIREFETAALPFAYKVYNQKLIIPGEPFTIIDLLSNKGVYLKNECPALPSDIKLRCWREKIALIIQPSAYNHTRISLVIRSLNTGEIEREFTREIEGDRIRSWKFKDGLLFLGTEKGIFEIWNPYNKKCIARIDFKKNWAAHIDLISKLKQWKDHLFIDLYSEIQILSFSKKIQTGSKANNQASGN